MRKRRNTTSFIVSLITKVLYTFIALGLIIFISISLIHGKNADPFTAKITPTPSPTASPIPTNTPAPTGTPVPTVTPLPIPTPEFTGLSCIITDNTTQETILSINPELQIYPASTIKLVTAMVALDLAETDMEITISQAVVDSITPDVTSFHTPAGTTYSLEVWLNLLLIHSYGDAANAIAEGTAGSVENFVMLMNQKVTELGLVNTSIDNAIGLDIGNDFNNFYSTAEDMLVIMTEAIKYPLILEIVSKPLYTVPDTPNVPSVDVKNTNPFLTKPEEFYSDMFTVIGGKTGSTNAAGNCLTMLVTGIDGHEYICVYYGGADRSTMCTELIALLEYAIQINMSNH